MSAPDTNLEKQEKKHKVPLVGMIAVVGFALVLLVVLVFFVFADGEEPDTVGAQVDGRTGEVVPAGE